jgi:hypothetical protein
MMWFGLVIMRNKVWLKDGKIGSVVVNSQEDLRMEAGALMVDAVVRAKQRSLYKKALCSLHVPL